MTMLIRVLPISHEVLRLYNTYSTIDLKFLSQYLPRKKRHSKYKSLNSIPMASTERTRHLQQQQQQ